jgi:hypothetical protein
VAIVSCRASRPAPAAAGVLIPYLPHAAVLLLLRLAGRSVPKLVLVLVLLPPHSCCITRSVSCACRIRRRRCAAASKPPAIRSRGLIRVRTQPAPASAAAAALTLTAAAVAASAAAASEVLLHVRARGIYADAAATVAAERRASAQRCRERSWLLLLLLASRLALQRASWLLLPLLRWCTAVGAVWCKPCTKRCCCLQLVLLVCCQQVGCAVGQLLLLAKLLLLVSAAGQGAAHRRHCLHRALPGV